MITRVLFKDRVMNEERLKEYGFKESEEGYEYQTAIAKGQMELKIKVKKSGEVITDIIDIETGERYLLHLIDGAAGEFVGLIREEYESILRRIEAACFDKDVFKSEQARGVIRYIRERYGDELEYLWDKFPMYAVWRRKDSRKWYGILLTIPAARLGLDGDDIIEILDLRVTPSELEELLDERRYFFGYHMNKKNWMTICLNGTVALEEIYKRIDESYKLATKKRHRKVEEGE